MIKKNLKKLALGAGIVFMSHIPKSFSQENILKDYLRIDIGKEVIDFDKNSFISKMYCEGNSETKNIFLNLEAMMADFSLNDYLKSNFGFKLLKNKKINLNPQITAFAETEENKNIEGSLSDSFFKLGIGAGAVLNYDLKKLKGRAEIVYPSFDFNHFLFYTRHSFKIKESEFEIFYKGENFKENYFGAKFIFPYKESFGFFIEYSISKSEIFKEKDFLNLGLTIKEENK